jgi:hypothetical protein
MLAFTLALQFRANVTILILSRWTKYTENNASWKEALKYDFITIVIDNVCFDFFYQ